MSPAAWPELSDRVRRKHAHALRCVLVGGRVDAAAAPELVGAAAALEDVVAAAADEPLMQAVIEAADDVVGAVTSSVCA